MKKTIAMAAAMIVSFSAVCMNSFADDAAETKVYVTISDKENNFALTQKPVTVTDTDNDGKLTITDALYCAHEENFEGGAEAGYVTSVSDGYISVLKLWGIENSMSYLFHVNSGMANSLTDEIKDGDYVDALMFPDPSDLEYYYSWFDQRDGGEVDPDTEVELKLSYASFDRNWTRVVSPLADAKITINGKETEFVTDAEGNVKIKLTEAGEILAKRIYERHTVLTRMFINLGVDEETAAEDACRVEHYISDKTFDAIKAHMMKYGS